MLRQGGHQVFAPTLTGLAERSPQRSPAVGLSTHIDDMLALIESADLRDVVLCGHSSGGLVITGVADRTPERVRALCYLDAFIPADGDSLLSLLPDEMVLDFLSGVRHQGEGWLVPPPPVTLWVEDPALGEWVTERVTMQPLRTFTEGLVLSGRYAEVASRWHIVARDHPRKLFWRQHERLDGQPSWQLRVLPGRHDLMLECPTAVGETLLEIDRHG